MKTAVWMALSMSLAMNIGFLGNRHLHWWENSASHLEMPSAKPDLQAVEKEMKRLLEEPEHRERLTLKSFQRYDWMCAAEILETAPNTEATWRMVERVVDEVSRRCGLPGRVAGIVTSEKDPARITGHSIEFGYMYETGYLQENEHALQRLRMQQATPGR